MVVKTKLLGNKETLAEPVVVPPAAFRVLDSVTLANCLVTLIWDPCVA